MKVKTNLSLKLMCEHGQHRMGMTLYYIRMIFYETFPPFFVEPFYHNIFRYFLIKLKVSPCFAVLTGIQDKPADILLLYITGICHLHTTGTYGRRGEEKHKNKIQESAYIYSFNVTKETIIVFHEQPDKYSAINDICPSPDY